MTRTMGLLRPGRIKVAEALGAKHGEPWRAGNTSDSIVSDKPDPWPDTILNREAHTYYGGTLIGESMSRAERDRAIECVNFCAGVAIPGALCDDYAKELGGLKRLVDALELCYKASIRGVHAFESEDEAVDRVEFAQRVLQEFGRRI